MQFIVIDGVAWPFCRSVCHHLEPWENSWIDRDALWSVDLVGPRNHAL